MPTANSYPEDELGPETVVRVHDPETGVSGVLVVDNTLLGPAGGGTRMRPDVTEAEVASLARAMTNKFAILGMARGGSKAAIRADPAAPRESKRAALRAFGRAIRSFLASKEVACGPDMGVTAADVQEIYEGAGVPQLRSGLFEQVIDQDPAAYHITGHGVIAAVMAACERIGIGVEGATIAVEGFGQVGAGCCRRAAREGARVVAVSTTEGALYDPSGLDVERLLALRRTHGDRCVLAYESARRLPAAELFFLPVDVVIPGAQAWVITEANCHRIQARVVCSAGNITTTDGAQELLWRRDVVSIPDFVANGGAAIASWVDFLRGTTDQAFAAIDRLIRPVTAGVLDEAFRSGENPHRVALEQARRRVLAARGTPRLGFDEAAARIRAHLGVFPDEPAHEPSG